MSLPKNLSMAPCGLSCFSHEPVEFWLVVARHKLAETLARQEVMIVELKARHHSLHMFVSFNGNLEQIEARSIPH